MRFLGHMSTGGHFNTHNSSYFMKINGCIHTLTVVKECRDIGLVPKCILMHLGGMYGHPICRWGKIFIKWVYGVMFCSN